MSKALEILKKVGAVITDSHFVGTSGKHFGTYINKDALYPHTQETSQVCELLAGQVKDLNIDTVVGPALGGIILSTWTAHHLSKIKGKEVCGIFAEKTADGGMVITRGFDAFLRGKNVLVVEDLTTTGGSAKKVVEAVKAVGGNVLAVCVMVNKNPKEVSSESVGAPFLPLDVLEVPTYDEENCPLCKSGVPINTTIGHGKKFLESKQAK